MNNAEFNHELKVYISIDAVKSLSTDEEDQWIFEGIASTGDMDLYDEVVYPESFINSIEFFKNNGKIFFDHDYAKANYDWLSKYGFSKDEILSIRTPIGRPLDAKITDDGLYIRAVLNKEHPMSKIMWMQYLKNQDPTFRDQIGLSIGAKYLGQPKKEYDTKKGKYVTYLPDLLLYEVSMTPVPVNPFTKTWASAMKSMVREAEENQERQENSPHHVIVPDEVVFKDGKLVIKSTVEGDDGSIHTFESRIDLKEDVIKTMTQENENTEDVAVKAVQPPVPEKQGVPVPPQGEPVQEGAPVEGVPPVPEAPAEGAPPVEGGEEMPVEEGAAPTEDGASAVLEALVSESEEGGQEDELGADMNSGDDSQEMILDKLDTVLDTLSQLAELLQGVSPEAPAEGQVTHDTPMLKSIIDEVVDETFNDIQRNETNTLLLSIQDMLTNLTSESGAKVASAEISDESVTLLADTIKSALSDMEDRIVADVTERVLNEGAMKSVSKESSPNDDVVHPGTIVETEEKDDVPQEIMKSITSVKKEGAFVPEEKMDTLKSMISEYVSITGYTSDKSQMRARVLERAQKELDLHPTIFSSYVNKAQRGKL